MYQILEKDFQSRPDWFSNWKNLSIVENYESTDKTVPILIGADLLREEVRSSLIQNRLAIYMARGYVGNHLHKKRQWWRYSINAWANTKMMSFPYSRWEKLNLEKHPWKVKQVKNVLIAPSKMTQPIWDSALGWEWAQNMNQLFPGANIKIRPKPLKSGLRWATLIEDLEWADLIVAQGSAITAEAFWYGKKVISLGPCITWAAQKNTLEEWQDPSEPKLREEWHEHLAWCQFNNEEWCSGEALTLIEKYIGSIKDYQLDNYRYPFT